jgi:hypothetical protein
MENQEQKAKDRYQEVFLCEQDHLTLEPAEILGTLPCTPNAFRKRVRKVTDVLN